MIYTKMASTCNQCNRGYRLCHNNADLTTPNGSSLIIKNDVTNGNITVNISDNINRPTEIHTFILIDPLDTGNSVTIIPPAGHTINGVASYVQAPPILVSTFIENSGDWLLLDEITTSTNIINPPGSSTDNAAVRWDGAAGDTFQDSIMIIDDSTNVTGLLSTDIAIAGTYQKAGTRIFDINPTTNSIIMGTATGTPTGIDVIVAGNSAAGSITTGTKNILIGQNNSDTLATNINNVSIGSNVICTRNNNLVIGNSSQSTMIDATVIGANSTMTGGGFEYGIASIGYGNILSDSLQMAIGASIIDLEYSVTIGQGISSGVGTGLSINIGSSGNTGNKPGAITIGHNAVTNTISALGTTLGSVVGKNATCSGLTCAVIGNDTNVSPTNQHNYIVGKDISIGPGIDYVDCIGSRSLSTVIYGIAIGADSTVSTTGGIVIGANATLPTGCTRSSIIGTGSTLATNAIDSTIIGSTHTSVPPYTLIIGHTAPIAMYYQWHFANMPYFDSFDAGFYLNEDDVYINISDYSTTVVNTAQPNF